MCECSDNPPSVHRVIVRKAAKEHHCYECGATIAKGDLYELHSGIWDHEPSAFKWCDHCATLCRLVEGLVRESGGTASEGFCWTYGSLRECVSEFIRWEDAA